MLLFHVSDIHFGAEDPAALDWFSRCVQAERPAAVIVTGDLTMRARSREFAAAGAWLASLGVPVRVEVGNHDVPYSLSRFIVPYRRYRAIQRMIERPLDLPGVTIVPLKTTARFQWRWNWSKGVVSNRALARALTLIAASPPGNRILVAAHHPLLPSGTISEARTRNGPQALAALAKAGADAVLTGHVHDPFDVAHIAKGRTVRLIGAGTLSARTRAHPPSFNAVRIENGRIAVVARKPGETRQGP